MDRADDGIVTEALANGLPFDVIILSAKNNRDKGVMVKLISGGGGGGEAAGSDKEGDTINTEGGGLCVGSAPEVYSIPGKGK